MTVGRHFFLVESSTIFKQVSKTWLHLTVLFQLMISKLFLNLALMIDKVASFLHPQSLEGGMYSKKVFTMRLGYLRKLSWVYLKIRVGYLRKLG